jgi:TonB family protein
MSRRGAVLLLAACLAAPAAAAQDAPLVAGQDGVPVPKRTRFTAPEYPPEAQARGVRGIVILAITIDARGRVSEVDVVRSIPGLDEAAIAAARRWEYEPLRVDGKPVAVRLTVPISFLLKLPEMTREDGVPELSQGAAPGWPPGASSKGPVRVTAELFVDANGHVVSAGIDTGEQPWSDSLLAALRTWSFVPDASNRTFAVEVRADFSPVERSGQQRVALHLGGLRRNVPLPADVRAEPRRDAEPTVAPRDQPAPEASPEVPASPPQPAPPSPAPASPAATSPVAAPAASASPSPAPAGATPDAAAAPSAGASPAPGAESVPAAGPSRPAEPPSPAARPAQPAAEVLRGPVAPPTPPPVPGASAVRDVQLGAGVPDLAKGRRPVMSPFARMAGATGTVTVRFAIDGAGATSVADVAGPEPLQAGARSAVESWTFRRTSIDRLRAVAEITYRGDTASASVRIEEP